MSHEGARPQRMDFPLGEDEMQRGSAKPSDKKFESIVFPCWGRQAKIVAVGSERAKSAGVKIAAAPSPL